MGGGYANPFAARDPFLGNIYGNSSRGDAFGRFGASIPGHALTLGTAASMASGFGLGGGITAGIGNTLGMGAMSMGPQILATAALQYAAGQMSRGQEQNQISQNLSQRVFGERNIGGRMGLGASRDAIAGFSGAFRELANSSEMLTNDQELKNVLNKFSDMKLLDTSKNLSEMGERVKKMSKTLREISMDLGTTLEGALPDFQRHAQMGFMDPDQMRQSIRTNRALRGVGINMSDSTIQSFEMAQAATTFAMGGDKRIGALGAQRTLGNLSVATSMGLLTDEDLMAATGKRGEDAVADLAQQSMQASSTFMQSGNGRLIAAALGEVGEDGQFTGGIDAKVKRRIKSMSMSDISKLANQKLSAKGAASSFERRMKSGMGANMGASMDMSEFASVLGKVFDNENDMVNVLEQLTGMRGQSIDVLLKMQKDGDRIIGETKRRTRELSRRNRMNAIIQRDFTFSGRLDRAYRDYIAEPIGQPLQTMGSEMGTAFSKYGDNFGNQMMKHGVATGFGRALFGLGINEDQAQQSYEDRMSNRRSDLEAMFGEGSNLTTTQGLTAGGVIRTAALGVAGAATFNPLLAGAANISLRDNIMDYRKGGRKYSIFGDEKTNLNKILDASYDLQERESEVGMNSTTFGNSNKGFMNAYLGKGQKLDYTDEQKQALLRGALAAYKEGSDIENMTEEFAKTAFDWTGAFSDTAGMGMRKRMEAAGGQYGALKQLMNDKSLTEGDRKMVSEVVQRMESQLRNQVTLDAEEDITASLEDANTDLANMFDSGTDGIEEEWFSSKADHIENTYLHGLLNKEGGAELNKLESYMQGLTDITKVRKLFSMLGPDVDAKQAVKIAKEVFGVKITEKEGESAKHMFRMFYERKLKDGNVDKFYENISPMAKKAVQTIKTKKRAEAQNRKISLMKELDRSKGLSAEGRKKLTTTFRQTVGGQTIEEMQQGATDLFDLVQNKDMSEDLDKVEGELGGVLAGLQDFGTTEESIKEKLRTMNISAAELEGKSLEQLKQMAVQEVIRGADPITSNTTEGRVLSKLNPEESSKLMADLSNNVSASMEVMTSSAMRYQRATTEQIKKLQSKTGG
jgi:hypothetical protein